jgi:lysophospholipase L1-like esterase
MRLKKGLLLFAVTLWIHQILFAQNLRIDLPVRYLALGDSYTIGESVSQQQRWPVQLFDSLAARGFQTDSLHIIARTGWRTDNLRTAMLAQNLDSTYSLVSLLIGVNNQFQGRTPASYWPEFEDLLQTAIGLAGGQKERVFVLSIPDYAFTPFGQTRNPQAISSGIDDYNAVNEAICRQYDVKYYNITPISRQGIAQPNLVANDGLHPSGLMYTEWVKQVLLDVSSATTSFAVDEFTNTKVFFTQNNSLRIQSDKTVDVKLWNVNGQLILEENNLLDNDFTWPFAKGTYVYEVSRQGKRRLGKLVYF